MTPLKADRRFRKRYILRTLILLVPPLVAFVLIWRRSDEWGPGLWAAVAFFVAWIAGWILLDAVTFRTYRCPSCGQPIRKPTIQDRGAGDPIRYYCSACDTEWDTGLSESRD